MFPAILIALNTYCEKKTEENLEDPYKLPNGISSSLKPFLSCISRSLGGSKNLIIPRGDALITNKNTVRQI